MKLKTKSIDFRGARGSNTGDDYHELWAVRQAIRLLSIERHGQTGPWSSSLLRQEQFVAALPQESATNEDDTSDSGSKTDDPPIAHSWSRETLIDGSLLQEAVRGLWDRMRTEREFHHSSAIFESARQSVSPADRAAHIAALAGVDGLAVCPHRG